MNFQIRVIDYYTESANKDVLAAKEAYLRARDFYANLTKTYNDIMIADANRVKYLALKNLYDQLLNGKTNTGLNAADAELIQGLLDNSIEKENLKLLSLYKVQRINTGLETSLIDSLVTYKNSRDTNTPENAYNIQYAKPYDFTEINGDIYTFIFDFTSKKIEIFDYDNEERIWKIRERILDPDSTDEVPDTFVDFHDNDENDINKTLFKYIDMTSGVTYYYLANKDQLINQFQEDPNNSNILEEDIVIQYIPATANNEATIKPISKTDFQILTKNSTIEEYTLNTTLELLTENIVLLNEDDMEQVKIDPYLFRRIQRWSFNRN